MVIGKNSIIQKVKDCLITAASTLCEDKIEAYQKALRQETAPIAKWVLELILENAFIAKKNRSPLCDDTGIPHLFIEVGQNQNVDNQLISMIHEGIREGLRELPGRPMAIDGDGIHRIDQSGGLNTDPGALLPSPIIIKPVAEDILRLHILMNGGGPEIRAKTFRVFHQHKVSIVTNEIIDWAIEGAGLLGCSPVTLAIGIGRSHFEAVSLMMEAMVFGNHNEQSEIEKEITTRVNMSRKGPLGLGGKTTALGTFLNIGPQRASGVRIVSLRPCCCYEPRKASVML